MTGANQITVRTTIRPGDIGYITYLHGILYSEEYKLDYKFEGYVASSLGEFAGTFDEGRDRMWVAAMDHRIVGSIAIASQSNETAQLRWFLVHPSARGMGLGSRLLDDALSFCRGCRFRSVF